MNNFLKKNQAILVTSVVLNAFFLIVVFLFLHNVYGLSILTQSPSYRESGLNKDRLALKSGEEKLVIETVAKANPAVVSIVATTSLPAITEDQRRLFEFFTPYLDLDTMDGQKERQVGAGSGFFVSADGLLVTNRHVVDDSALDYTVVTSEGDHYPATVIAKDPIYDVAILKVEIENAPFLTFDNSDDLVLGESVIAIGNALAEFSNSITKGVVSGLSRSIVAHGGIGQTEFLENVIQTDAGINPGNSGGPLLNLGGNVVGVNVAVAVGSENIGFALPSNLVGKIVQSVKEEGRIVRPFLGVRYIVLNDQIAALEDLPVSEGAWITASNSGESAVVADSPAARAGLREGDIIIEFNGRELTNKLSLQQVIRDADVGDEVEITILRNGKKEKVKATLEEAPQDLN